MPRIKDIVLTETEIHVYWNDGTFTAYPRYRKGPTK